MRFGTVLNADMLNALRPAGSDGVVNGGSVGVDFVDGQINIHGQLVGGQRPAPSGLDQLVDFVKANPLLVIGGAVGLYLVAKR